MMKRRMFLLVLALDPVTVWPTRAAVLASGHAAGTEWRSEAIGFNPYANLPVAQIGVRFTDGKDTISGAKSHDVLVGSDKADIYVFTSSYGLGNIYERPDAVDLSTGSFSVPRWALAASNNNGSTTRRLAA